MMLVKDYAGFFGPQYPKWPSPRAYAISTRFSNANTKSAPDAAIALTQASNWAKSESTTLAGLGTG
jgi:hypothetical protein